MIQRLIYFADDFLSLELKNDFVYFPHVRDGLIVINFLQVLKHRLCIQLFRGLLFNLEALWDFLCWADLSSPDLRSERSDCSADLDIEFILVPVRLAKYIF